MSVYYPGNGMGFHKDKGHWDDGIATVTFISGGSLNVVVAVQETVGKKTREHTLEDGSMYCISGDAQEKW